MDIRSIAQSGAPITKTQLTQVTGLSDRSIRTAIELGVMSPACGKTRSAYYTYQHIIEADSVRAALKKGLPMTSLVNDERSVAMPRERGRPKGRVYLVTANLMLVELGPQTPLDDEVRKQVVRLGWQRSKDK